MRCQRQRLKGCLDLREPGGLQGVSAEPIAGDVEGNVIAIFQIPVAMPCACIVAHVALDDVILALHIQAQPRARRQILPHQIVLPAQGSALYVGASSCDRKRPKGLLILR